MQATKKFEYTSKKYICVWAYLLGNFSPHTTERESAMALFFFWWILRCTQNDEKITMSCKKEPMPYIKYEHNIKEGDAFIIVANDRMNQL